MAYKIIDPSETSRAMQFSMWKDAPIPMVTVGRVFDITNVVNRSKEAGMKLNMLMLYCIIHAAKDIKEFYCLPCGDYFKQYDSLSIQTIVVNKKGTINFCDIPFAESIKEFSQCYDTLTSRAIENCENLKDEHYMRIGTSAVVETELDTVVNQYVGENNPFICWGKYRKDAEGKCNVQIFLQFDHKQMDGHHIAQFFNNLQQRMNSVEKY